MEKSDTEKKVTTFLTANGKKSTVLEPNKYPKRAIVPDIIPEDHGNVNGVDVEYPTN